MGLGGFAARRGAAVPDLELTVVDPRNLVWLYPAVWRAARANGAGVFAALRAVARAGAPVAVVVDGNTLIRAACLIRRP